jgi:hypothetical protein
VNSCFVSLYDTQAFRDKKRKIKIESFFPYCLQMMSISTGHELLEVPELQIVWIYKVVDAHTGLLMQGI